ncbi:unnamed protein product [Mortierella alpina]
MHGFFGRYIKMPPQPPEETSVLSHRSVPDSEPRLAIHPKDPLAYTSSQNIGLKGLQRSMHTMECNPMMQQQQHQAQYTYEDQQAMGDGAKGHFNQSTYGQGLVHSTKNSQHLSISTMLQNGMQPRKESSFPGAGARLDPSLMPPTPTMTPVGVPDSTKEYLEAAHGRTHSHYFDFSPHLHHQQPQQQPQQITYRYPPVPPSQDFSSRSSSNFGNSNGYQPQTPGSSTPNFASINSSPSMESFHSANASPFFHPQQKQPQPSHDYGSLSPSPLELAARARHYRSSEQDAILDATAVQAASLAVAPHRPTRPWPKATA